MLSWKLYLPLLLSKLTGFLWRKWANESSYSVISLAVQTRLKATGQQWPFLLRGILVFFWLTESLPSLLFSSAFVRLFSFNLLLYLPGITRVVKTVDTGPALPLALTHRPSFQGNLMVLTWETFLFLLGRLAKQLITATHKDRRQNQ